MSSYVETIHAKATADISQWVSQLARAEQSVSRMRAAAEKPVRVATDARPATAAIGTVNDQLKALKAQLGEESALGNLAKALRGGGMVAGVGALAEIMARAAEHAADLATQVRMGSASVGDMVDGLARAVPFFGQGYRFGAALREVLTGAGAELAKQVKDAERLQAVLGKAGEIVTRADRAQRLAGLSGVAQETQQLAFDRDDTLKDIEALAREARAIFDPNDRRNALLTLKQAEDAAWKQYYAQAAEIERKAQEEKLATMRREEERKATELRREQDRAAAERQKAANAATKTLVDAANDVRNRIMTETERVEREVFRLRLLGIAGQLNPGEVARAIAIERAKLAQQAAKTETATARVGGIGSQFAPFLSNQALGAGVTSLFASGTMVGEAQTEIELTKETNRLLRQIVNKPTGMN